MRAWRLAILLTFGLLIQAPIARSQQVYGGVEGRLRDASGEPLPDAAITITGPALQGMRGAISDKDGHYLLQSLPVGLYTIRISHVAHQQLVLEKVAVELGATTNLGESHLEALVREMPPVVVTSTPTGIDPSSTVIRTRITSRAIESLPGDRNFQTLVGIAPDAGVM